MAYIRYTTSLPSGKTSGSYVIGDPVSLMSYNNGCKAIPYPELVELFKTKTYAQIKRLIYKRLKLTKEECETVCERLFEEHRAGEWDHVPQWSIDFIKKYGNETMLSGSTGQNRHGKKKDRMKMPKKRQGAQ